RALRPCAASPTPSGILPGLDHHRSHRRQVHDLTPTDAALPGQRQPRATPRTGTRPTAHDGIRPLPTTAASQVPTLRTATAPPTLHPIRLEPDRWRHRGVRGRLRRRGAFCRLSLTLSETTVEL